MPDSQQQINYGNSANDGTGDPLRTAFIKVDDNFDAVWNAGPVGSNITVLNNTISTVNVNGNLVLSPNGVGVIQTNSRVIPRLNNTYDLGAANLTYRSAYIGTGGLSVAGNLSANNVAIAGGLDLAGDVVVEGNLTVEGDTIQIGNIVTDTKTIQLSNTAASAAAANGSGITAGANDDIATLLYNSSSNAWTTNIGITVAGNISAAYLLGDASGLTSITGANVTGIVANAAYAVLSESAVSVPAGNITGLSNVATTGSYNDLVDTPTIPTATSNLTNDSGFITAATANVISVNDQTGTVTLSIPTATSNLTNDSGFITASVTGNFDASGNVTANYFVGDGSQLTGLPESYGNANVVTLLADFGSNTIDTTGIVAVGSVTLLNNARIKDTSGDAVAFGVNAGETSQGDFSVAIGYLAGESTQGTRAVAIGQFAGDTSQGADAVAIGSQAGETSQGEFAVAIGYQAGNTTQGAYAVAVGGYRAGYTGQGASAVAVGGAAGYTGQGGSAVAIGQYAGYTSQGADAVAIGTQAGETSQSAGAVAMGENAGRSNQGTNSVALGNSAGKTSQGAEAVAIGRQAGNTSQGLAAVAIGALAGETSQGNNSIIINATNAALDQTTANTFTVAPVRNDVANVAEIMFYNTTSKEITYGNTISVAGNISGGNVSVTGNITGNTAGFAIGYRDIPQVSFTGNVTMAAADAGRHFYSTESTDYILTIADNSAVSWPVGTAITVVNRGTGNITVAQAAGVSLYLAGNSSAGNRTVSTYGMVTLLNVAANVWMINGTGVA